MIIIDSFSFSYTLLVYLMFISGKNNIFEELKTKKL